MDNHPLSPSTRQTRSALLAVSLAGIGFVFFSDPAASSIKSPLGISFSIEAAKALFILGPVYLMASFIIAAIDDIANKEEAPFLKNNEEKSEERIKRKLATKIDRFAGDIRGYLRTPINDRKKRWGGSYISQLSDYIVEEEQIYVFSQDVAKFLIERIYMVFDRTASFPNYELSVSDWSLLESSLASKDIDFPNYNILNNLYSSSREPLHKMIKDIIDLERANSSNEGGYVYFRLFRERILEVGFPLMLGVTCLILNYLAVF